MFSTNKGNEKSAGLLIVDGLENPTPSIDYKEEYGSFEDIKKVCRKWLEV
jgi:hypothetical protein